MTFTTTYKMFAYKGQPIPPVSDDVSIYHNLRTHRKIIKGDCNHHKIDISLFTHKKDDPRIYGTTEEIIAFQDENKHILGDIKLLGEPPTYVEGINPSIPVEQTLPPKYTHAAYVPINAFIPPPLVTGPTSSLLKPQFHDLNFKPPLPFDTYNPLTLPSLPALPALPLHIERKYSPTRKVEVCLTNKPEDDIDQFTPEVTRYMRPLSFVGLHGKGKIVSIIKYNILTILVYVNLAELMKDRLTNKTKSIKKCSVISKESLKNEGFFTVLKVQLADVPVRKNTPKELYKGISFNIYYTIIGCSKMGMALVRLYEDCQYTKCINTLIATKLNANISMNQHITSSIRSSFCAADMYPRKELKAFLGCSDSEDTYESEDDE